MEPKTFIFDFLFIHQKEGTLNQLSKPQGGSNRTFMEKIVQRYTTDGFNNYSIAQEDLFSCFLVASFPDLDIKIKMF